MFLGFFLFVLSSMNLMSSESPLPSLMPRRSNHITWCQERGGTGTLGRVAVALGLWSADIIVSDQTGAAWQESCSSCPGNWTVAIEGS
jgi:hypothetical protein